jgi:hypothetical protein
LVLARTPLTLIAMAAVLHGAQLDLDCAHPAAARSLIARTMLSEIEWAEDVNRAAMWEAFGRCAGEARAESCRDEQQRRFGDDFERQKAAIQAKYNQMVADFTARCQASIARGPGVVPFRPGDDPARD